MDLFRASYKDQQNMTKIAIISGAGIGGLSAAWWLSESGWRTVILEKASSLKTAGYMLGLSGVGYELARRMGLLPALARHDRRIDENIYRGRDGDILWRVRYPELLRGLNWITLARADLVNELYALVESRAEVRFNTTVKSVITASDGSAEVMLTDGSEVRCDVLIGAEGTRSTLRQLVFGEDKRFISQIGYRCASFQTELPLNLGKNFESYAEPGRLTEFYTLGNNRTAAFFAWHAKSDSPVGRANRIAALRAAFQAAHPVVMSHLNTLNEDLPFYFGDLEMVEMPNWHSGPVALIGDAAHCLTLISGQGAGMAMAGACILSQELAVPAPAIALARYDRRLRPTILKLQKRARKTAPLFIPATKHAFARRNFIMKYTPKKILGWYISKTIRSESNLGLDLPLPATGREIQDGPAQDLSDKKGP